MGKISVGINDRFRGEYPRYGAAKLPNNAAQDATNARLLDANLGAWKNFLTVASVCKTPPVNTIYLMDDTYWLQWTDSELGVDSIDVDVARSTTDDDGRIFITGLDVPRWTDSTLVAAGSGCYPQETRPLGVINPDTAPSAAPQLADVPGIDITDAADQFDSWARSGIVDTIPTVRSVTNPATGGNPSGACYYFKARSSPENPYMERDFGVQNSAVATITVDFNVTQKADSNYYAVGIGLGKVGGGQGPSLGLKYDGGGAFLEAAYATNHTTNSVLARTATSQLGALTWYKLRLTLTRRPDGSCDMLGEFLQDDGVTLIASVSARSRMDGGYGALATSSTGSATNELMVNFDNVVVQASGAFNDTSDDYTTSYVYTFVNDQGEESGPSPASDLVSKDDGTTVLVMTPVSPPTGIDYSIVSKRIYRAVTVAGVTSYYFLAEQLLWYQAYYDSVANATLVLNETLATIGYELPPSDLRGILVLPNDIYAGFSGRNLCLSARGQPHAWPIANRYAIDTDIVAIGAIDAQVVILGETWPWLAAGNEPSVFSMNNTEVPQGCSSKRSVAYLKGIGVVYASPDGLVGVAGTGQVSLLTSSIFTRKEWQELNPATIIGAAHDNRYVGFYTKTDGTKRGFVLEAGENGFGVVTLGFHAAAVFVDESTDRLYLVIDVNDVPEVGSGGAGSQVPGDGATIYAFDQYEGGSPTLTPLLPRRWRSKLYRQPWLNCYRRACVRAEDYADVWFLLYADGTLVHTEQVTGPQAFVLPDTDAMTIEFEIIGTSSVESVELAHDVDELEG